LLDPRGDFGWLIELEKNLALVMRPRSKADRLVFTEVLVEAGLTLMMEAEGSTSLSTGEGPSVSWRLDGCDAGVAPHPPQELRKPGNSIRNLANINGWW
jgi:hypothetical protein